MLPFLGAEAKALYRGNAEEHKARAEKHEKAKFSAERVPHTGDHRHQRKDWRRERLCHLSLSFNKNGWDTSAFGKLPCFNKTGV